MKFRAWCLFVSISLVSTTAMAQATRTWVSGVGDDANPCSRTAPCKTFAGAISKTAAGGEIDALDPGGFGGVTITKSITLNGGGTLASILVSGSTGIIINAAATDNIVLRNISLQGLGGVSAGTSGVRLLQAASLRMENVDVAGFGLSGANAIDLASTGTTKISLRNVSVLNCVSGADGVSTANATGAQRIALDRVQISGCARGLNIDDQATAVANDSDFSQNTSGVAVTSSSIAATLTLDRSRVVGNTNGIVVSGVNAKVRLSDTTVQYNATGLSAITGASIESFNNNRLNGNTTDGAPTSTVYQR